LLKTLYITLLECKSINRLPNPEDFYNEKAEDDHSKIDLLGELQQVFGILSAEEFEARNDQLSH